MNLDKLIIELAIAQLPEEVFEAAVMVYAAWEVTASPGRIRELAGLRDPLSIMKGIMADVTRKKQLSFITLN